MGGVMSYMERINLVDIRIPQKLYDEICENCDDPEDFCLNAVTRLLCSYPDD